MLLPPLIAPPSSWCVEAVSNTATRLDYLSYLKRRTERKQGKANEVDDSIQALRGNTETIQFGEVAQAPPQLKVKPRQRKKVTLASLRKDMEETAEPAPTPKDKHDSREPEDPELAAKRAAMQKAQMEALRAQVRERYAAMKHRKGSTRDFAL